MSTGGSTGALRTDVSVVSVPLAFRRVKTAISTATRTNKTANAVTTKLITIPARSRNQPSARFNGSSCRDRPLRDFLRDFPDFVRVADDALISSDSGVNEFAFRCLRSIHRCIDSRQAGQMETSTTSTEVIGGSVSTRKEYRVPMIGRLQRWQVTESLIGDDAPI